MRDQDWLHAAAADARANIALEGAKLSLVWAGYSYEEPKRAPQKRTAVFFADTNDRLLPVQVTELAGGDGFYSEATPEPPNGPEVTDPAIVDVDIERPGPAMTGGFLVAADVEHATWTSPGEPTRPVDVTDGLVIAPTHEKVSDPAYECASALLGLERPGSAHTAHFAMVNGGTYALGVPPTGRIVDEAAAPLASTISTGCGRPAAGMVLPRGLGEDITVGRLTDKAIQLLDGTSGTPYLVRSTVRGEGRTRVLWVPADGGRPVLSKSTRDDNTGGERPVGVGLVGPERPALVIGLGAEVRTDPALRELGRAGRVRVFDAGFGPTIVTAYEAGRPVGTNLVEAS